MFDKKGIKIVKVTTLLFVTENVDYFGRCHTMHQGVHKDLAAMEKFAQSFSHIVFWGGILFSIP